MRHKGLNIECTAVRSKVVARKAVVEYFNYGTMNGYSMMMMMILLVGVYPYEKA